MYESGLKTLGLVEQVGCVTRGSTGGIVLHVFMQCYAKRMLDVMYIIQRQENRNALQQRRLFP